MEINRLSPEALQALKAFLSEKDERQQRFEALKKKAEEDHVERGKIVTINDFEEDWQHSQVGALTFPFPSISPLWLFFSSAMAGSGKLT